MARCWLSVMTLWLIALWPGVSQAQDKACAIVLLHGKWGNPQYVSFFARKLDPPCVHKSLEMPWAERRAYDVPYAQALQEIAAQVKAFREMGYQRVLLAGHSFGANAAIAYMTEYADVDGIISMAVGHTPAFMYRRDMSREGVDQARALVAAGKADEKVTIQDLNVGRQRPVRMRADAALSYFDPEGLGEVTLTTKRWKRAVPVLWLVGAQDTVPATRQGPAYGYDNLPAHPASRFLQIEGDHRGMLDAAAAPALEWIKALP